MIGKLLSLTCRAVRLPFRKGLVGSVATARFQFRERWLERRLGIQTGGHGLDHVRPKHGECIRYEPLSYECLEHVVEAAEPGPKEVFLDYGCGLGRAVIFAATRPFGRVIGVEYEAELAERAKANIKLAARRLKCPHVEIVHADATTYDVPDDVSVVYLFNPFTGSVMSAVQDRLRESVERRPRRLRIIYMIPPDQCDLFADVPWVALAGRLPTGHWPGCGLLVYDSTCAWRTGTSSAVDSL